MLDLDADFDQELENDRVGEISNQQEIWKQLARQQTWLNQQEDLNAGKELLQRVRERPDLLKGLGLLELPTIAEILRRLKREHDLVRLFREQGLEPDEGLQLANLVSAALRAYTQVGGEHWCQRHLSAPGGRFFAASSLFVVVALIFGLLAVWWPTQAKLGWREGTCNILQYHGTLCTAAECTFDVEAQERAGGVLQIFVYKGFKMPLQSDHDNEPLLEFASRSFRCCNPGGSLNCCDMYDSRFFFYCDNFPHLDDPDGNPCPEGDWPCLFKASDGGDASDLIAYDDPVGAVMAFLSITVSFALFGIGAAMMGYYRRRHGEDVDAIESISVSSTSIHSKRSSLSPPRLKLCSEKFDSPKLLRELYTDIPKTTNQWEGFSEALHDDSGAQKTSDFDKFGDSLEDMRCSVLTAPLHMAATETGQSDEPWSPRPPDVGDVTRPVGEPVPLPGRVVDWEVSLSNFATGASAAAATVSLIEPLQSDVLEWRQHETLRQAGGRARCGARSASGPPAAVRNAVADTRRAPGTKGGKQLASSSSSVITVRNRDWDFDEDDVRRLVAGAPHQRESPAPPKSPRPGSPKGSQSTVSRSPGRSPRSRRPNSSPAGSSISNKPASAMSSPAKLSPESPMSSQPQSGRSKLQAALHDHPHGQRKRLGGAMAKWPSF